MLLLLLSPLLAASLYYKKLLDFVCLCWTISVVLNHVLWSHGHHFFVQCELKRSRFAGVEGYLVCLSTKPMFSTKPMLAGFLVLFPEVICLYKFGNFLFCTGKSNSWDVAKNLRAYLECRKNSVLVFHL
jgi:hypothetical protein